MDWDPIEAEAVPGRDRHFMEQYVADLKRCDEDFLREVQKTIDDFDEQVREDLKIKALQRGRTVLEQVLYEIRAIHGLCPVDEGDTRIADLARLERRMSVGSPLQG